MPVGILSAPGYSSPPGAHTPSLRRSLLRLPRDASESRFRDGGDRGSRVRHPTRARPPPLSASLPDGAIDEPTQTRRHLPKSQLTSEGPGRCTFYGAGQVCDDFRPLLQGLTGTFPALISSRSLMFPDKGQSPAGRRVGCRQGPGHSLLIPTVSVSHAKTACDPPPRAEPSALTTWLPLPPAPRCGPLLAPSRGSVHSPGLGDLPSVSVWLRCHTRLVQAGQRPGDRPRRAAQTLRPRGHGLRGPVAACGNGPRSCD